MVYQGIQYLALMGECNGKKWEIWWWEHDQRVKPYPIEKLLRMIRQGATYRRRGVYGMIVYKDRRYGLDPNARRILDHALRQQRVMAA